MLQFFISIVCSAEGYLQFSIFTHILNVMSGQICWHYWNI